jgi:dihydrodipicolinate synthase/N-acetylneuraminate lyase
VAARCRRLAALTPYYLPATPTEVRDYVAAAPQGFEVYSGNDRELADVLAAEGTGAVSGCSAALPEPFLDLAMAVRESRMDSPQAEQIQDRVNRVVDALGPSIGRIKYAQQLRGLLVAASRMTVAAPDPDTESVIKALVTENAR